MRPRPLAAPAGRRHRARAALCASMARASVAQSPPARRCPTSSTSRRRSRSSTRCCELADVKQNDVVYDLGSGDGRIVITAAKKYGARGVGIELDPALVKKATENAAAAGVSDRVRFVTQNLFTADISEATRRDALSAAEHQRAAAAQAGSRVEAGHARRVARVQHGTGMAAGEECMVVDEARFSSGRSPER